MPVGTQATVKALDPTDLEAIGARMLLTNAYHLHLRPGDETIAALAKKVPIPIEMGGGVRTQEDIEKLIMAGVKRVILGTRVVQDRVFLKKILQRFGEKIAVARGVGGELIAPAAFEIDRIGEHETAARVGLG